MLDNECKCDNFIELKTTGAQGLRQGGVHRGSYFTTLILLHFIVCIYREFASETSGDTAAKKEKGKKEREHTTDCGQHRLSTVQVHVFAAAAAVVIRVVWRRGKKSHDVGHGWFVWR